MTFRVMLSHRSHIIKHIARIAGFSMVFVVSARVSIPLLTAVPMTLQTLAVLVCGVLGGRYAVGGFVLYLVEGCAGMPVFSGGGAGLLHLVGPTGGYLVGMLGALVLLARVHQRRFGMVQSVFVLAVAHIGIFACGLGYLSIFVPLQMVLKVGLYPFIVGEVIKLGIAGIVVNRI